MRTRVFWLTATLLTLAALVLASCSPRTAPAPQPTLPRPAPKPAAPTTLAPVTPTPTPAPSPAAAVEKPKYGGTISFVRPSTSEALDPGFTPVCPGEISGIVYDQFVHPDWSKGLAGSGEVDWGSGAVTYEGHGPDLAESWEIPEVGTWIFKIRRGARFALNPASEASRLVGGRELTADDIVWNVRRLHTDPAYPQALVRRNEPAMAKALTVEKTGAWEVTLKTPVDPWIAFFWVIWGGCSQMMLAPEVVQKYGNAADWRNMVGSGAFMLTDFVSGSAATFKRNSSYWGKNPVGPGKGDQLPYADSLKLLIVPDTSTRVAVIRTGRADWVSGVEMEDGKGLIKTNPQLNYKSFLPGGTGIYMQVDKAELPFKDKRIRQALMMATQFESLKNDLYRGDAEIPVWPVSPAAGFLHVPVKDMPETVQALYKYNPERAKQLIAEAGYPNGFKAKILVRSTSDQVDPASVLKSMWAKVGVDLEIRTQETSLYQAMPHGVPEQLTMRSISNTSLVQILVFYPLRNPFYGINDPTIEAAAQEMGKYFFLNMPKVYEIHRKTIPYLAEQAYVIPLPTPISFTFWQPWLKNHYGEQVTQFWTYFAWVDQDLKEKMTGKR